MTSHLVVDGLHVPILGVTGPDVFGSLEQGGVCTTRQKVEPTDGAELLGRYEAWAERAGYRVIDRLPVDPTHPLSVFQLQLLGATHQIGIGFWSVPLAAESPQIMLTVSRNEDTK